MADTQRLLSAILALAPDNAAGDIAAQDLRDIIMSLVPGHGALYISSSAIQPTIVQNTWYEVAGTWAQSTDHYNWHQAAAGSPRLQYDGAVQADVTVIGNFSFISASNNITYCVGIGLDGTVIPASIQRSKIATGADTQSVSCAAQVEMPAGTHYVSLMIRNITDTAKPTVVYGHLNAISTICDD